MAKYPRFMIAQNALAEPGVEYVLHTQRPRFLAKLVRGNTLSDFEIVDEIDRFSETFGDDVMKHAKLMRRLGDWYMAYKNGTNDEE